MVDWWWQVAQAAGRASDAPLVALHVQRGETWVRGVWLSDAARERLGAVDPRPVVPDEELLARVLREREVRTEPLAGVELDPGARGRLAGLASQGLFVGLPGRIGTAVLWIALSEPLAPGKLAGLCELLQAAACHPRCPYGQFFDHVSAAFLVVGEEGEVRYANPFFATLCQLEGPVQGQSVELLFGPGEWRRLRQGFADGCGVKHTAALLRSGDDFIAIDFMGTEVRDEGGARTYLVLGCDLRIERQLGHYRRLEAVERMFSGIAHELNNPLQTVVGNAEMLSGMKLPDSARRRALRVLAGARRCQEVVDGLLKLNRKRRDDLHEEVAIDEVARQAAQAVTAEFEGSGVTLRVSAVEPVARVKGSRADLQQAVQNVLRNAFQAVAQQGEGVVELTIREGTGQVLVEVQDGGQGLSCEVLDRAFEPFFSTRGVGGGKGLGLSVALGIVEEHGGTIDLRTIVRGAHVVISLPRAGR